MDSKALTAIQNYYFPPAAPVVGSPGGRPASSSAWARNLANYITPVQLQRIRQDVASWRDAIRETEQAYYPHRVKMQRLFLDTVLNGHVESCMERRSDLTLLRDFKMSTEQDGEESPLTSMMRNPWFYNFLTYCLDALAYGYTLVSLGDLVNDQFPNQSVIKRWHVSPDRYVVNSYVYSLSGVSWMNDPEKLWHIYIPTPTRSGVSPCGYGYLYNVALYEIICRNVLGNNADFTELFSAPFRKGKTVKTEESERAEFAAMLQNMGSAGWGMFDEGDEVELLEAKNSGTGWQGYENLEARCEKKISKIILGHADAMDSTPGKLGAGQDGEESPVAKALAAKQTKDGAFIENIINTELLPRMREMGVAIPEELKFFFKNDTELELLRQREDESNKVTAEIAQIMKNAGMKMDPNYFTDRTGIPAEAIEEPDPMEGMKPDMLKRKAVQNQLKKIYNITA